MAPVIPVGGDISAFIDEFVKSNKIVIFSKTTCPFCAKVKKLFGSLGEEYFALELNTLDNGAQIQQVLAEKVGRSTVPQVFVGGTHIGGCDDTMSAYSNGKLKTMLSASGENYEYDLIVLGGGSGGLAASKTAAKLGKKVAVFDFVTPTPIGTTWGLGGTCVNVGCIPKKLMHQAALLGQAIKDARKFGWTFSEEVSHNWSLMRGAVQDHIGSLNWNYKVQLRTEEVKYVNAHAQFVEPHKVKAVDKRGKETFMTASNFIVATGERPRYPDCEGAKEYGITSDDLFSLPECPGKTLVVGASYVALECAGFLAGIGLDVTLMVRSILLRGFDQDMAERIGEYMANEGIKILRPCIPMKIEEIDAGPPRTLRVTGKMGSGEEITGEYNTILFAIGRDACTRNIGLETVGVKINPKNGKIPVTNEQTNVPHIYAIGDVLDGLPELTPVAIEAGYLLAKRLFSDSNIQCDYTYVPTTVFTPLEYGCIGYPEESAYETFGEENVEVYHSNITPLEWTVAKRPENACYVKIICLKPENERIIGFHYLGPNAGEVTQGFVLGIKMGVTKAHLDATIGIHPTCAEIFTTLRVTKTSGASTAQKGC